MGPLKTRDGTVLTNELIEALADEAERATTSARPARSISVAPRPA